MDFPAPPDTIPTTSETNAPMDTLGLQQLDASLRVATLVAPVVLYFLLLGVLNTRRTPQLLTGKQDLAMLLLALSPLAIGPVMNWLGSGWPTVAALAGLAVAAYLILMPRRRTWVIYNLPPADAPRLLADALADLGHDTAVTGDRIVVDGDAATIDVSSFPVIRNVTLRLTPDNDALADDLEEALAGRLARREAEPSPMAVAILLVATGMAVAPLALLAHHTPELVRLLGDLLR